MFLFLGWSKAIPPHAVRPPRRGCYLFALVPTFCNLLDLFFPDAELSKFSLHYDSVDVS